MQPKVILIAVFAVFLLVAPVPAEDFTWTNTATALQYWDASGIWSVPGFPRQAGDVAEFVDLDEYAGVRTVELNVNDYYTCAVIRCTAQTNRYEVRINTYLANGLFMENTSGNAAIILDDSFVSNTPPLMISGHNLNIVSPTDITVSNAAARIEITAAVYGAAPINKYGPGQLRASQTGEYSGTITVNQGELYCNSPANLHAATLIARPGAWITYDYGTVQPAIPASIVLEGGWLFNNGNAPYKALDKLTVNGQGYVTTKWYHTIFNGSVSGTGTLHTIFKSYYFVGDVRPGFSVGELALRRDSGTLYFGTNGTPVTLHIETSPADHDILTFANLDAASTIVLSNINLVVEGAGTGQNTNWFLVSNRMVADLEFNSVSYIPGLLGEVIYDYANNRVGIIAVPEPAVTLVAAGVLGLLIRRRR
ncbi:PEP-CTERM sorting domain-containing protein [bacterium]|nr:PEP-CTERM sorting domain-containing protein [bacterium]